MTPKAGTLSTRADVKVPSGAAPTTLEKKDLIAGTGASAQDGDTITVNYVGVVYKSGKIFDSSWSRKAPTLVPAEQRRRDPRLGRRASPACASAAGAS